MAVVIGIDGGGSKTLLAAADEDGTATACLRESGCNPFDEPGWRDILATLGARSAALRADAAAVALGMPGYGEVVEVSRQQEEAAAAFSDRPVIVMNDVQAAFEGAFAGRPGVLLLAGTGSMAWASAGDGSHVRVGGWGDAFGDEGSAFWIGKEAVTRASRAIDGRDDAPGFGEALFSFLGLPFDDPYDALIGWYRSRAHLRSDLAALALFVDREAEAGRPEALRILDEAADHLARHVVAAWRAIGGDGPIRWSVAGGAFASAQLRTRVADRVGTPYREPILPPVGGALRCAAIAAGWAVDRAWIDRLRTSLISCAGSEPTKQ
ncbi:MULTISPECIES: N-acetylglucosamine kinase [Inquilinus]|uniref:N-acetylglucosamine kinase-like BadF-type ATPase n=1 Tax=Inquilinus ginsengisoli TaxID=363840 RepID=A0ABU1JX46_9PROT|nr:BadF/BadG/BcrA/BcrD ATPase family protein [Inquilinus ginsengisoli]MDR6293201.1 N-acetylglucosamine kinase-like BadF-type ATPase [Inquilinus ginsengisoli]